MSMPYFTITSTTADVYDDPGFTKSVVTQGILGESCKILGRKEEWVNIQMEDGYAGWIHEFHGLPMEQPYESNTYTTDLFSVIVGENQKVLKRTCFGSRLNITKESKDSIVILPNGNSGYFIGKANRIKSDVTPREEICRWALGFQGIPYRWGGRTSYGFDCSGLVQTTFYAAGLKLPRDAWQQSEFLGNETIDPKNLDPGDLLFFTNQERITHVGISIGGDNFIHSQGEVRVNSLNKEHELFNKKLSDMIVTGKSINSVLK